jgi:hypothetical protein
MNILSAHQSSSPICPAMQSVSEMCRNEVDESVCRPACVRRPLGHAVGFFSKLESAS